MIEFHQFGSTLSRDGLHMHMTQPEDLNAACGASGVSFSIFGKFKYENGEFFEFFESSETWRKSQSNPISCKKCYNLLLDQHLATKKPVKVDIDEWYFWGCFITKDDGLTCRPRYQVCADVDGQEPSANVGTMKEAKQWCKDNRVMNPVNGLQESLR